jgi:citrate synthase
MDRDEASYSQISAVDGDRISIRGRDLVDDIIDTLSFTDMVVLTIVGHVPDEAERRMVDAILISLVDHGVTPSTFVARLSYNAAPEAVQGAIAAGLLNSGSRMLGSMENTAKLLHEAIVAATDAEPREIATRIVREYRDQRMPIPGIGHRTHAGGDPRADKLLTLARETGIAGTHVELLRAIAVEASYATSRHLPINVTGAIGAILLELGVPWQATRGFGLMSRIVGLVAHIAEEQQTHTVRDLFAEMQRRAHSTPAGNDEC